MESVGLWHCVERVQVRVAIRLSRKVDSVNRKLRLNLSSPLVFFLGLLGVSFWVLIYLDSKPVGPTYTFGFGVVISLAWHQRFALSLSSVFGFVGFVGTLLTLIFERLVMGLFCGLILAAVLFMTFALLTVLFQFVGWFVSRLTGELNEDTTEEDDDAGGGSSKSWSCLLPLVLIPVVQIESLHTWSQPCVEYTTVERFSHEQARVWRALRSYDEVSVEAPWVLHLGLPRPLRTSGLLRPGEEQICHYTKSFGSYGYMVKRCSEFEPGRRIGFEVTSQALGFDRSFRLIGGAYRLSESAAVGSDPGGIAGTPTSQLAITTKYQARLQPRWFWQPIEDRILSEFHRHLIDGIRHEIEESTQHALRD